MRGLNLNSVFSRMNSIDGVISLMCTAVAFPQAVQSLVISFPPIAPPRSPGLAHIIDGHSRGYSLLYTFVKCYKDVKLQNSLYCLWLAFI